MTRRPPMLLIAATAVSVLTLSACGSGSLEATGDLDASKLTIYSAQHKNLTEAWAKAFQDKTGTKVQIRFGNDSSMGAQLVQEGDKSPADVFLTENSPAMTTVQNAGLFATVDPATIAQVGPAYVPSSHEWVGHRGPRRPCSSTTRSMIAEERAADVDHGPGRARVEGRWSAAAGGADFQAIVSAMLATKGEEATAALARGLKAGAKIYQSNIAIMKARELRPGADAASSTTTTGTATRREKAQQRRARSCTTSGTRTPGRSSACPAVAS